MDTDVSLNKIATAAFQLFGAVFLETIANLSKWWRKLEVMMHHQLQCALGKNLRFRGYTIWRATPAHLTLTHGTEIHWQGFGITIPCPFKIPWAAKRQEQESQGQKCRATLKSQSSIWQNSSIPNSTERLLPKPRRLKKELLQIRVLAHVPCRSLQMFRMHKSALFSTTGKMLLLCTRQEKTLHKHHIYCAKTKTFPSIEKGYKLLIASTNGEECEGVLLCINWAAELGFNDDILAYAN